MLLGVALLATGAGAWLLSGSSEQDRARVLGVNQPVNPSARDPRNIDANNSPTLARNPVDPANLAVSNRIDLPQFSCALNVSFNGGASWEDIDVPFPAGEEEPARCYAPDVDYAPDGTLHMSYVTLKGIGNVPNAVWTVSSRDGGRTISVPVKAAGALAFQVQLTADPRQGDRLYLSWLQAEATGNLLFPNTGNPIVTSTSTDGGSSWSAPVNVSPPTRERVVAPSPALGPGGELFVLYLDLQEDRLDYSGAHEGRGGDPYDGVWALVLARSTDQGVTWTETLVDGEIVPTMRFIVFLPPQPTLAIDPESGRIYAAFTDGRLGDADVNLWTSSDGGRSFGSPLRVNDTPPQDGTAQYMPRLDVAPGGRVDVVYFDRRFDETNIFNEVSLQSSFDQGRSFTPRVRVSDRGFDSRVGPGSERDLPDLGNRLALVSTARRALAVWPDTRGGSELTGRQDLASAVIDVPRPTGSSLGWLRVPAGIAMALGLVSLLSALRPLRGRRDAVELDPSVARPAPAPKERRSRASSSPLPAEAPASTPPAAGSLPLPARDPSSPPPEGGGSMPHGSAVAPPAPGATGERESPSPGPPLDPPEPEAPVPPGTVAPEAGTRDPVAEDPVAQDQPSPVAPEPDEPPPPPARAAADVSPTSSVPLPDATVPDPIPGRPHLPPDAQAPPPPGPVDVPAEIEHSEQHSEQDVQADRGEGRDDGATAADAQQGEDRPPGSPRPAA